MDDPKKPKMDPIFEELLRPLGGKGLPKMVRPEYSINDPGLPRPAPPPRTSSLDKQLALDMLQMMLGPPPALSPAEAELYLMARRAGYRPVQGTLFGVDHVRKKLYVDMICLDPAQRLLSVAHELGHIERISSGKMNMSSFLEARNDFNPKKRRYAMLEEILAWRLGMRLLRRLGVRFSNRRAVRAFRHTCLSTYRTSFGIHGRLIRSLKVEGI
jgi:hypothetical protein